VALLVVRPLPLAKLDVLSATFVRVMVDDCNVVVPTSFSCFVCALEAKHVSQNGEGVFVHVVLQCASVNGAVGLRHYLNASLSHARHVEEHATGKQVWGVGIFHDGKEPGITKQRQKLNM